MSPSLHKYTTSCISSFCEPLSLKGALEQFVSSLQPAQCCGVVTGLLWLICVSCDLSPFPHPALPVLTVPSLPGVAEGVSGGVGPVSQKVAGTCLRAADSWHCARADVENGLAL